MPLTGTPEAAPLPSPAPRRRGHHAPLEYHRLLLDDPLRMAAYEQALRRLVRPGDVVLDLGCGTGVLGMLALRQGAARVHGVESAAVAGLARQLVAANGLAARMTIHQEDMVELAPVELVDLVVADFLGRFVVDDGMLPAVRAAGAWMKPGARFCPGTVELLLAPAGDFTHYGLQVFTEPFYGLDLRAAVPYALNYCYHAELPPTALLGPAATYARLQPPATADEFDQTVSFTLERDGLLQGLAGWFVATLAPDVVLQTGPGYETHWGQYLFPLPPTPAQAGDRLTVRLWLEHPTGEMIWRWTGQLERKDQPVLRFALESEQRLGQRPAAAGSPP
ncbi:MAG: 50S ribosomal protein L11 methyltransferase [Myxococcota bacterium]|jgi:SAM-dependent methyltransferase|nr:50S ribosomal protein L11 methyltransferase [Myxococcota bacterium]